MVAVAGLARLIRNKLDCEDHAADTPAVPARELASSTENPKTSVVDDRHEADNIEIGRNGIDNQAPTSPIKDIGRVISKVFKRYGALVKRSHPVRFTTFAPTEAEPGAWHDLLCYIHLPSMQATIEDDSNRRRDETVPVRKTMSKTEGWIARGTKISIIPHVPRLRVNPERIDIIWVEDWHRSDFRIMADPDREETEVDQSINGAVEFFVEGLLVGRTPVSIFITETQPLTPRLRAEEAIQYRSIFVSYSRKDADIVSMLGRAHNALGDTILRDVQCIRSGQNWHQELHQMIDNADIFQLFWSNSAQASKHVEKEWRYALKKRKREFIRPVYWREPVAPIPPDLRMLHFAFVPIDETPGTSNF